MKSGVGPSPPRAGVLCFGRLLITGAIGLPRASKSNQKKTVLHSRPEIIEAAGQSWLAVPSGATAAETVPRDILQPILKQAKAASQSRHAHADRAQTQLPGCRHDTGTDGRSWRHSREMVQIHPSSQYIVHFCLYEPVARRPTGKQLHDISRMQSS